MMKQEIEKALAVLAGKAMWRCTRAADLAAFQFGARRASLTWKGEPCEIGEYALHVQCTWRITQHEKVIVARRDLYYPADYTDLRQGIPANFDWDIQGGNRHDRLLKEFFQDGTRSYMVERIEVGDAGAFRVILENGFSLEVFPDDSLDGEHWRLFKPDMGEPHFVVSGAGIAPNG
jgi:hypothetical protein